MERARGPLDEAVLHAARPTGSLDQNGLTRLLDALDPIAGRDFSVAMAGESEAEARLKGEAASAPGPLFVLVDKTDDGWLRFIAYYSQLFSSLSESWIAWGYLQTDDEGRLSIRQITIEPEIESDAGVTATVWRSISPAQILAMARVKMSTDLEALTFAAQEGLEVTAADIAHARSLADAADPGTRRGRPPRYTDSFYRLVALIYLGLQKQGYRRGIVGKVAEHVGVERDRARDLIHGARSRGWLTKGRPGAAGASEGPRLIAEREALKRRRNNG